LIKDAYRKIQARWWLLAVVLRDPRAEAMGSELKVEAGEDLEAVSWALGRESDDLKSLLFER